MSFFAAAADGKSRCQAGRQGKDMHDVVGRKQLAYGFRKLAGSQLGLP